MVKGAFANVSEIILWGLLSMFRYMQYEKGELTLPVFGEQNFELVNLIESIFYKSQYVGVICLMDKMDGYINGLLKGLESQLHIVVGIPVA